MAASTADAERDVRQGVRTYGQRWREEGDGNVDEDEMQKREGTDEKAEWRPDQHWTFLRGVEPTAHGQEYEVAPFLAPPLPPPLPVLPPALLQQEMPPYRTPVEAAAVLVVAVKLWAVMKVVVKAWVAARAAGAGHNHRAVSNSIHHVVKCGGFTAPLCATEKASQPGFR
ncbi:hypothetical protein VOLCADRAFT_91490 [Volvox carteri f. nagariensis]|uniref:Uncharacterized protein n=1 Tax=Volvox carteri f. nagariensis TaxID=3068 RepID=D8TX76_VOLCA|nr:uncharacterized protein VOLCADRAFT_91490 [Volvox carteri f. nagariensis]EFJ47962.1 hypothetical protein VOLCADRAFT_91490 [Volvox carteri f. nagariensis]|eukprot:XP_002951068.1 hypothetical protein VOLCADRAFT_91490 [Volvox carteri f. nagariensis]